MADLTNNSNADESTPARAEPESAPRTPRWVIVLGIVAVILILAVAAQFVLGLGHGPGLHGA